LTKPGAGFYGERLKESIYIPWYESVLKKSQETKRWHLSSIIV